MPARSVRASTALRTTRSNCSGSQGLSRYWKMPASLTPAMMSSLSV